MLKCIKRKLLWVVVLLFVGIGLSGCLTISQEDYMREAEKYMEKKYGEEFKAHYYSDSQAVLLSPVNCPEWWVTVSIPETKLWGVDFQDNYVAFLLKGELEEKIEGIASEVYGRCIVMCPPYGLGLPGEWGRDTTLEAYNTRNISDIRIYVSAELESREDDLEVFLAKYRESGISANIMALSYVTEQQLDDFETTELSEANWRNHIGGNSLYFYNVFIVLKREEGVADKVRWREGKLEYESIE